MLLIFCASFVTVQVCFKINHRDTFEREWRCCLSAECERFSYLNSIFLFEQYFLLTSNDQFLVITGHYWSLLFKKKSPAV